MYQEGIIEYKLSDGTIIKYRRMHYNITNHLHKHTFITRALLFKEPINITREYSIIYEFIYRLE